MLLIPRVGAVPVVPPQPRSSAPGTRFPGQRRRPDGPRAPRVPAANCCGSGRAEPRAVAARRPPGAPEQPEAGTGAPSLPGFPGDLAGVSRSSRGRAATLPAAPWPGSSRGRGVNPRLPPGWGHPPVTAVRHRGIWPHVKVGGPGPAPGVGRAGGSGSGLATVPSLCWSAVHLRAPSGPDPAPVLEGSRSEVPQPGAPRAGPGCAPGPVLGRGGRAGGRAGGGGQTRCPWAPAARAALLLPSPLRRQRSCRCLSTALLSLRDDRGQSASPASPSPAETPVCRGRGGVGCWRRGSTCGESCRLRYFLEFPEKAGGVNLKARIGGWAGAGGARARPCRAAMGHPRALAGGAAPGFLRLEVEGLEIRWAGRMLEGDWEHAGSVPPCCRR